MGMTLQEIKTLMEEAEIKCHMNEEKGFIISGWGTEHYKDEDGDKGMKVVVRLDEDGEYIKVFSPQVYKYKEGPYLAAVLEACMHASWAMKMVQFEYDPSDGEIRAIIEFPLEDGKVTKKQLKRMVSGLVGIIDECDSMIRTAIETGQFVPKESKPKQTLSTIPLEELEEEIKRRRQSSGESPKEL